MFFLKNFYLLIPGDPRFEFFKGHLIIKNGKIERVYHEDDAIPLERYEGIEIINGHFRRLIFPGFIQSHIHLCQTLHRHRAENLPLMEWLSKEIWPYEASLDRAMMARSVVLSLEELLTSGVTSVLDMGTVHHQDVIFEIMAEAGFRYTGGKAMMDHCPDAPPALQESTANSVRESKRLAETWNGKHNGLLHYALSPRFILSCTPELLREVRLISDDLGLIIHTHASEHPGEVAYIREIHGCGNVEALEKFGALNRKTVMAHLVHLDEREKDLMARRQCSGVHCPSTNLKLGSGIAPMAEYIERGFRIALGSDGAPCNNALSIFNEMRLAALLPKGLHHNPLPVTPEDVLRMTSIQGARVSRQEPRIGRLQPGMEADLVILDMDTPQTLNFTHNPAAAIVYGADSRNVSATMVRGCFLYRGGQLSPNIQNLIRRFDPGERHSPHPGAEQGRHD